MNLDKFDLKEIPENISKRRLFKLLECSSQTLREYHDIAMNIPDFENEYPRVTSKSTPITKVALTKYQVWVIFSLIKVSQRLTKKEVSNAIIYEENLEFTKKFSKAYYYENHGICQEAQPRCTTIEVFV